MPVKHGVNTDLRWYVMSVEYAGVYELVPDYSYSSVPGHVNRSIAVKPVRHHTYVQRYPFRGIPSVEYQHKNRFPIGLGWVMPGPYR